MLFNLLFTRGLSSGWEERIKLNNPRPYFHPVNVGGAVGSKRRTRTVSQLERQIALEISSKDGFL